MLVQCGSFFVFIILLVKFGEVDFVPIVGGAPFDGIFGRCQGLLFLVQRLVNPGKLVCGGGILGVFFQHFLKFGNGFIPIAKEFFPVSVDESSFQINGCFGGRARLGFYHYARKEQEYEGGIFKHVF